MIYILYHGNCYDGFGAAFAAWKRMGHLGVKYIPVSYGFPPPDMPDAKKIYILDFSYLATTLFDLSSTADVVLIDHHKTAEADLGGLIECGDRPNLRVFFDMTKSGALMAWEYFHTTPPPMLIQHISDRDLWKFELPGSREIHKALVSYPMDFELWDGFDVEELKKEGVTCDRIYSQLVNNICKGAFMRRLDGHDIPVVNTSIAWSEVGQALLEKYPEARFVASFTVFEDQTMWSLRCRSDFDVSEIAKKFGGGGHKEAAGFKTARF